MVLLDPSDSGSSPAQVVCQICRKHTAKYTCPSCNLRYCSIECFRSENHVNCSEAFYKNSIVNDVRDRSDVDPAEKSKMLDMLKRIQDMGEDDLDGSDDDSEQDPLAALAGVDLDSLPPEEILKHLTPEQRRAFEELLADPTKAAGLFSASDEDQTYWWSQNQQLSESDTDSTSRKLVPAAIPRAKLLKPSAAASSLGGNLVAILAAYALTIRVHGEDAPAPEKQELLLLLLPFISEKSTLILKTAGEACDYILANAPEGLIIQRRKLLLLLLDDLSAFLHTSKIRTVDEADGEKDKAYLALSDVHGIFSAKADASRKTACKLAAQKVFFYISNLDIFDREGLTADVARRKRLVEAEDAQVSQFDKDMHDQKNIDRDRVLEQTGAHSSRPIIEEIGE